jgi:hypothetical protein
MFCMCSTYHSSLCIFGNSYREPSLIRFFSLVPCQVTHPQSRDIVALWELLKMQDGVCEASKAPGLSPKIPGTCSYLQWVFPRLQRDISTFTQKRWYCSVRRLKWKKLHWKDTGQKPCFLNSRYRGGEEGLGRIRKFGNTKT